MGTQTDACRTYSGTWPGDCFADIVFPFLWARHLQRLELAMKDMGVLDYIPTHEGLLRLDGFKEEVPLMPFMEPTWMDDTCVTFAASPPLDLERAAGRIGSSLLRLCDEFAMSPNLAKGKTGLMFVFQGRGANKVKTYQRLYAIQTLLMKASQKAALKARYGTVAWMDECGRMCMCIPHGILKICRSNWRSGRHPGNLDPSHHHPLPKVRASGATKLHCGATHPRGRKGSPEKKPC